MDTSEEYIKMCNCPEIQEQKPKGGNEISCYITSLPLHVHISKYGDYWETSKHLIWLPRQDQIQEMLGRSSWVICYEGFNTWYFSRCYPSKTYPNDTFDSMEQIWLAFYMFEKHKNIWGGEKWADG